MVSGRETVSEPIKKESIELIPVNYLSSYIFRASSTDASSIVIA
ncbi:MAG: hypothetical protein AWU59_38 [Methanolobus sp. T82-4]|nr:MAG: hypothetical protein AWU59_38 [Methanolobus sp. T82-4]